MFFVKILIKYFINSFYFYADIILVESYSYSVKLPLALRKFEFYRSFSFKRFDNNIFINAINPS
jgi:hypothetical protein